MPVTLPCIGSNNYRAWGIVMAPGQQWEHEKALAWRTPREGRSARTGVADMSDSTRCQGYSPPDDD
jgi:hypothetical protein